MTPKVRTAFAELRSLCQSTHSPKTWKAILDALKSWPDEATLVELAVPYATDHLNHWPDHFRNCDEHALELLASGNAPLYMSVLTRLGNITIYTDKNPGIPQLKDNEEWKWLVTNPALSSIRSLNVRNHDITGQMLNLMATCEHLRQLKHLDIGGNHFSQQDIVEFCKTHQMHQLQELAIWTTNFDDDAMLALGNNPNAANIEYLELGDTKITDQGLQHLANATHLQKVKKLFLWDTSISEEGITALADAPKMSILEDLELQRTNMSEHTMHVLANRPTFGNLKWLMIGGHPHLNDLLAFELADSPHLNTVKRLAMRNTGLSGKGFGAWIRSENARTVRHLDIADNTIPDAGNIIASNDYLPDLEELWMWNTNQHPETLRNILHSPHLPKLFSLYMSNCPTQYKYAKAAFEGANTAHIRELSLGGCNLGSNSIRALARAPFEQLEYLSLVRNHFGDKGLAHLLKSQHLKHLKTIYLAWNDLTDDALRMIAESDLLDSLDILGVGGNNITDEGIAFAANHPKFGNLKFFGIYQNNITQAAYDAIHASPYLSKETKSNYADYK